MSGAVNTGNIAKLLWPGLNQIWGEYKEYQGEYRDLFDIQSSDKAYEEDQLLPGLGYAPVKTQGQSVTYDTRRKGSPRAIRTSRTRWASS